jgi:mRNA-degrading endonuclease YafQ of YafQ-DinJ toxin-antitoxin module
MPKIKSSQIEALLQPENDIEGNPIEYKYSLFVTNRFKKDVKRNQKSGLDLALLVDFLLVWQQNEKDLIIICVASGSHTHIFE